MRKSHVLLKALLVLVLGASALSSPPEAEAMVPCFICGDFGSCPDDLYEYNDDCDRKCPGSYAGGCTDGAPTSVCGASIAVVCYFVG